MTRFILRRLGAAIAVIFVVSFVVFSLLHLAPGDPATIVAGPDADQAAIDATRAELGLDRSLAVQYTDWLGNLLSGNLGESYTLRQPIDVLISQRIGSTLQLTAAATVLMIVLGVLIALAMVNKRSRALRSAAEGFANLALALPPFVSGVLLIFFFATLWPVLPAGGDAPFGTETASAIRRLILPAIALSLPAAPVIGRLLATEMRRAGEQEYVLTALAKGASARRITWRHIVPNSLGPAILEVGIRIGQLLGGAIVAEAIFARVGIGSLLVTAVDQRDYQLAQVLLMLTVGAAILLQVIAEVAMAKIDPRIRQAVTR